MNSPWGGFVLMFQWFLPQPGCVLTGLQTRPQPKTQRELSGNTWPCPCVFLFSSTTSLGLLNSETLLSFFSLAWTLQAVSGARLMCFLFLGHTAYCSVSGNCFFMCFIWFSSFLLSLFDGRRVNPVPVFPPTGSTSLYPLV